MLYTSRIAQSSSTKALSSATLITNFPLFTTCLLSTRRFRTGSATFVPIFATSTSMRILVAFCGTSDFAADLHSARDMTSTNSSDSKLNSTRHCVKTSRIWTAHTSSWCLRFERHANPLSHHRDHHSHDSGQPCSAAGAEQRRRGGRE